MSLERSQMFQCADPNCPAVVEVLVPCSCETANPLSCCDQAMKPLAEKTADQGKEKHVPVIEEIDGGYKVKVGSVPHPMEDKHHIMWIELRLGSQVQRQFLRPGDAPEATFAVHCCGNCGKPTAREYCNIHGLWKG